MQWIELLKKNYGPSQPESLRKVVSSAIGQSWRALLEYLNNNDNGVVMEFWLLLVELLQDYNVDCRNEAAKCVTLIISDIQGRCSYVHVCTCCMCVRSMCVHVCIYV